MNEVAQQIGIALLAGVCLFLTVMLVGTLIVEQLDERDAAESPAER